jgi:hypothetical protein
MHTSNSKQLVEESLLRVERWVESHEYKGYEPFDGLNSFLTPLTFGNLFSQRLLQQLVRQSPINIRPLLGIRPNESTKGRGYMAWGYLTMLKVTKNREYSEKAVKCLDWLIEHKAPGYSDYSWGNHFRFSSRSGSIPKLEPIIPWSSLIGQAFLDGYELLGRKDYLEVADSICAWILKLPRKRTDSGVCIGYNALGESTVHGASMLGAALLARTGKYTGNLALAKVAKEAMEYSCTRQNADGSWYYAEEENAKWIDNFHTGYNLDSLKCYIDNSQDRDYDETLKRGFTYFKNTFFEEDGRPKYYHNRTYPVDIQCASQAIDTLAYFSDNDETSLELSEKVARWTIVNMQDKRGFFHYRQLPYIRVKTPMLHWGQATMYKSLTLLLSKMK